MCRVRKTNLFRLKKNQGSNFFLFKEPFYDLSFSSNIEHCASCAVESDSNGKTNKREILFQMKQIHLSSVCIDNLPEETLRRFSL